MTEGYYVYVLCDPRKPTANVNSLSTNPYLFRYEPFYVGMGKGLRFYDHVFNPDRDLKTNPLKVRRIKAILRTGTGPHVVLLRKGVDRETAFEVERRAVAKVGRKQNRTGPLLNRTSGGAGARGLIHSAERRQALGSQVKNWWASLSEKQRNQFVRERTAAQNSPEVKARQSKSAKAYFESLSEKQRAELSTTARTRAKSTWDNLTPAQRKQRIANIAQGRHYSKSKKERAAIQKKATEMKALNRKQLLGIKL